MRLAPSQSFASAEPTLLIDAGLAPGPHRFRLEVIGASGRRGQPAEIVVVVVPAPAAPESPDIAEAGWDFQPCN